MRRTLAELRDRIDLLETGVEVLTVRQRRLVRLLFSLAETRRELASEREATFEAAADARTRALMAEGTPALHGIAESRTRPPELLLLSTKLQGLWIGLFLQHQVRTGLTDRGYGVRETSAHVDEAVDAHERVLELAVRVAEVETALAVVAAEVGQLRVRVNAMRFRLLPELRARRKYVLAALDERMRQERYRQRLFKRRQSRHRRERDRLNREHREHERGDPPDGETRH